MAFWLNALSFDVYFILFCHHSSIKIFVKLRPRHSFHNWSIHSNLKLCVLYYLSMNLNVEMVHDFHNSKISYLNFTRLYWCGYFKHNVILIIWNLKKLFLFQADHNDDKYSMLFRHGSPVEMEYQTYIEFRYQKSMYSLTATVNLQDHKQMFLELHLDQ